MSRYTVKEGSFGTYKTVILEDTVTGSRAEIALRGATLLNYNIPLNGTLFNIVDGYATPAELEEQSGARSCIMAPFSNRIENGTYLFNDTEYKMINPVDPKREVIHGFARVINFKLKDSAENDQFAEAVLYSDYIRRGSFQGYPFCIDMYVKFTLQENRLSLEVTGTNVGIEDTPFGCGWHPYFKTTDNGIDHLVLNVPADYVVEVDEKLIPLEGLKAFKQVKEKPEADYLPSNRDENNTIGTREVNFCYSGLVADKDGYIRTSIKDPQNGLKVTVLQNEGVVYAFSGDGTRHRPRKAIALEPVEYITNSYNRPELIEKLTIKPGESKTFKFAVEVESTDKAS